MTGLRKFLVWSGAIFTGLAIFLAGAFILLIVFDEVAYWRTLLRKGDYQQLDTIFSKLENEQFNVFKPIAWIFSREIHQRFPRFAEAGKSLTFSVVEKRAAPGQTCQQALVDSRRLLSRSASETKPGVYITSSGEDLCQIEYSVKNGAYGLNAMLGVGRIAKPESGTLGLKMGKYTFLKPGETRTFSRLAVARQALPQSYRILAIAGQRQRIGPLTWIESANSDEQTIGLISRAERLGLIIKNVRHEIKK